MTTETRRATANPGPCARKNWSPCGFFTRTESAIRRLTAPRERAVVPAVREVEREADDQPDEQPQPVRPAEAVDHRAADGDAQNRHDRQRRDDEAPLHVRPSPTHDPDADAHEDERE